MKQLGELCGIPERTVRAYVAGDISMTLQPLRAIAETLGVSLDWLVMDFRTGLSEPAVADVLEALDEISKGLDRPMSPEERARIFCSFYPGSYRWALDSAVALKG